MIITLSQTRQGLAEAERLRASLGAKEASSPRYRAWLCNLLVPRLREEKKYAEAEAMAREAVTIGEALGDKYLVAINQIVLGNVLRAAGRLAEAIRAYAESGRLAQMVGRPDIEGKSSRLLALTENTIAEGLSGFMRRDHADRAEKYATHAIGLLSDSFAWGEHAYAVEERGDARRILGREEDALTDYADAIAGYRRAEDDKEVERLLGFFVHLLVENRDAPSFVARAFGADNTKPAHPSAIWVDAITRVLASCPRTSAPGVLGLLVRSFYPAAKGAWWFHCLIRCLLAADRDVNISKRPDLGSLLILSVLGFSQHRDFSNQDLLTLAGLCVGRNDTLVIRHRPGLDLDIILRIGKERKVVFTVRTEAKRPEAVFAALFIGSFLRAFGEDLAAIIFSEGLPEGAALDAVIFAQAAESASIASVFNQALREGAVATARLLPNGDEEVPIVVVVRADAMTVLVASQDRGTDLEYMLAQFLQEVLHATLGKSLDDEIYSSKMRDLLMSVLH